MGIEAAGYAFFRHLPCFAYLPVIAFLRAILLVITVVQSRRKLCVYRFVITTDATSAA